MATTGISKSAQSIYTFENVYATIGNRKSPVSAATLKLMENAIPTLQLSIDPKHALNDSTSEASSPELADIMTWHAYYADLAVKRTTCQFTATIMRLDDAEQTLTLKDWILTGAGMQAVGASGSMAMVLTLQHPICLCQDAVLSMPYVPFMFEPPVTLLKGASNIKDALVAVMRTFAELKLTSLMPTMSTSLCTDSKGKMLTALEATTFLQQQMRIAAAILDTNMKWGGSAGYSAWPLLRCLSAYSSAVRYSLFDYFLTGATNNLWELIVQRITGDWMVTMMPVLNGAIELRPFSPWSDPAMYIKDEDISSLTLPAEDPRPITGISVLDTGLANTTSLWPDRRQLTTRVGVTYAPALIASNASKYRGAVVPMQLPGWMVSAQNKQAGSDTSETNSYYKEQSGLLVTPSNVKQGYKVPSQNSEASSNKPSALWTSAAFAYAEACFYSLFRQGVQAGVRTRLMLTSPGGVSSGGATMILPANTCSVVSSSGKTAFDFYVTSVVHSFDCAAGTASTEVAGTYARPSGGFPGIMPSGTLNPLYRSQ